ncbi:MAG: hypothetical protein AAFY26_11440 [Cyanobacteria bacterium J06638_22]
MDNWQRDWNLMFETVARDIERFFGDVAQGVDDAADSVLDFSETLITKLDETVGPTLDELDQEMEGWMQPFFELLETLELSLMDTTSPISQTVDPMMNEHKACVGCRHYHGQSYNGVMFVCGMHPYGWDDENCPDWESTWGDEQPRDRL